MRHLLPLALLAACGLPADFDSRLASVKGEGVDALEARVEAAEAESTALAARVAALESASGGGGTGGAPDLSAELDALTARVAALEGGSGSGTAGAGLPTGTILFLTSAAVPDGTLPADGRDVSRTTYPELFAAIGTDYGSGDGVDTFTLPDLRGRFVRAWSDGASLDAGRTLGSVQDDTTRRPRGPAFGTSSAGEHAHYLAGGSGFFNTTPLSGDLTLASSGSSNTGTSDNSYKFAGSTGAAVKGLSSPAGAHTHTITTGGDPETRPVNIALFAVIVH